MRANNALGIDDEIRGPEDGPRGMKPKMGPLTSTSGPGSDPSSQPTTSGHDLPVLPGQPSPRPGGPARTSISKAKPPVTVAKAPAPAPPPARRKPAKAGRPTAKPPSRGGRRT